MPQSRLKDLYQAGLSEAAEADIIAHPHEEAFGRRSLVAEFDYRSFCE